jgi:peptide/nickel transport system permease protein
VFRYIIRRLLFSIPVLLVSSILVFVVVRKTTDPTVYLRANPRARPADIIRLREQLGLNKGLVGQYTTWLSHFVRGDWGKSLITNVKVSKDIREALVNSTVLGLTGVGISLIIGVGIGVVSAIRQYSVFDHVATAGAFVGLSIPNFWFALLLQLFFGLYLTKWLNLKEPIFYTAGRNTPGTVGFHPADIARHLVLPMLVLAVQIIAVYSRYMRASILEVMHSDYLTTQVAIDVGAIAGGLIITEFIFAWPGMGRFFVDAMDRGDYLQVLPWVMVTVAFVIVFNLVADILYAVLDPRIRYA